MKNIKKKKNAPKETTLNSIATELSGAIELSDDELECISGGYYIYEITEGPNKGKYQVIWHNGDASVALFDSIDGARAYGDPLASSCRDYYQGIQSGKQLDASGKPIMN